MLRLGIVDFDSSHCVEFARRMNHCVVDREQWVHGARIVLGCPGESAMSPERIPGHVPQVLECGVELVAQPEDLLGQIDGVLILSVQGAAHLQRAEPFLRAGLPVFIDKPCTCSVDEAAQLFRIAREHKALLWSSSGMRFATEVRALQDRTAVTGAVQGALVHGPAKRHTGNPGWFHYGIHSVELLWTLMGPGCNAVTAVHRPAADEIILEWKDGRLATLRGLRSGHTGYGLVAFCEQGILPVSVSTRDSYRNLCQAIVDSFQSRKAPVPPETTLEIIAAITAIARSEQSGGTRQTVAPPLL